MTALRKFLLSIPVLSASTVPTMQSEFGFDINVILSEKAASELAEKHEDILAVAAYSGDPKKKPGHDKIVKAVVDAAPQPERVSIPGTGGPAHISGETIDASTLKQMDGPLMVSVIIASGRKSGPRNMLNCDIINAPVPLICSLASEHLNTEILSHNSQ